MFGFGKQEVAVLEKPKQIKLEVEKFPEDYDELAKEFELYDSHRIVIAVNEMFNSLDVPIYAIEAVESYMDKNLIREKKVRRQSNLEWMWKELNSGYNKLIPGYILKRAKLVKEAVQDSRFPIVKAHVNRGSAFTLQITDYEVVNPDPFIAANFVRLPKNSSQRWSEGYKVVFGVWDEPGFN